MTLALKTKKGINTYILVILDEKIKKKGKHRNINIFSLENFQLHMCKLENVAPPIFRLFIKFMDA